MTNMWRNEHYAILDRIQPNVMYAYLTSRGWKKEEAYGGNADFFALQQDTPRVLIPASSAIPDYGLSVWRILDTLSKIEERDSLEILRDLHLADFDRILVGYGENLVDDAMPVDRGLRLIQQSRNLLKASACSAMHPKPVFATRPKAKVTQYLRAVQLGSVGDSSFLVNLLSPISPAPFPSQVTDKLISGLLVAKDAAIQVNHNGDLRSFEESVRQGLSSNLCDTVGNLANCENDGGLKISVQRALVQQQPESIDKFQFTKSDVPALKETARILKARREWDLDMG